MRVATKRWGEVTIKKQGERKNKFDKTKSFSIDNSEYMYTIEELTEIFNIVTDLSEKHTFKELEGLLSNLKEEYRGGGSL